MGKMDRKFLKHVEALRPKIRELLKTKGIKVCERRGPDIPDRGVYLLSEGRRHVYVGRSNGIHQRLGRHCRDSSRHNAASFAFLLAREELGFKRHQFTREALMRKKGFSAAFNRAKTRIRNMTLRYVGEGDATRQALLEIYVAVVLGTRYNDFDTH